MIIVLVVHGMPPKDFPENEKMEFLRLHSQYSRPCALSEEQKKRHDALDAKMRAWPRTPANDMFHQASYQIAEDLKRTSGCGVLVAFNEFCAPAVPEVLDEAARLNQGEVVVVTPMLTRGGSHAELEIPEVIETAKKRNPQARFIYAWPFDSRLIASFLAQQIHTLNLIAQVDQFPDPVDSRLKVTRSGTI